MGRPKSLLSKIKSPSALKRSLSNLMRSKKRKVVFTNGCFDLLHKGHVTYLEKAKGLGDILVVALNGDESVRKLKGESRPINPLSDRLEVIAALQSVDFVTWFDQDTPLELIRLLKPRVLVKGGDWETHQIVGSSDVISWGGKVLSLSYVQGRSTTAMIARARHPE
jgi:rfaE bifunctional protein nucleotidyltransferase chain/domain